MRVIIKTYTYEQSLNCNPCVYHLVIFLSLSQKSLLRSDLPKSLSWPAILLESHYDCISITGIRQEMCKRWTESLVRLISVSFTSQGTLRQNIPQATRAICIAKPFSVTR